MGWLSKLGKFAGDVTGFNLINDKLLGGDAADAARKAGKIQGAATKEAGRLMGEGIDLSTIYRTQASDIMLGNQLTGIENAIGTVGGALQPYADAGGEALNLQRAYLGLAGQEAQQQAYDAYTESPGQAFLREKAEKALMRQATAMGGLGGGNIRQALQQQAIGLAQQDFANQFSRLDALRGSGQNAAGLLGQQLGNLEIQRGMVQGQYKGSPYAIRGEGALAKAQAQADAIAGQAQARASGLLGATQARQGAISGVLGLAGTLGGNYLLGAARNSGGGGGGLQPITSSGYGTLDSGHYTLGPQGVTQVLPQQPFTPTGLQQQSFYGA